MMTKKKDLEFGLKFPNSYVFLLACPLFPPFLFSLARNLSFIFVFHFITVCNREKMCHRKNMDPGIRPQLRACICWMLI